MTNDEAKELLRKTLSHPNGATYIAQVNKALGADMAVKLLKELSCEQSDREKKAAINLLRAAIARNSPHDLSIIMLQIIDDYGVDCIKEILNDMKNQ